MHNLGLSFFVLTLLALSCVLPCQAAQEVSGTVTFSFDLSGHGSDKEARLWIPYPASDRYQEIENLRFSGTESYLGIHTDTKYQRLIIFAKWVKGVEPRRLTVSFHVKRTERLHRHLPEKEPCWDRSLFTDYLRPGSMSSATDKRLKDLSEKIVSGRRGMGEKAMAIYHWVIRNMQRKPETCYCGDGDVSALLSELRGNCVDIHSVFVALLRAAGVPAREVFGIRLSRGSDVGEITKSQHCWAEYYLPGYGWVVMDPADVLKRMLVEGLDPGSEKARLYFRYYMGGVDAYRLRFGIGRDIMLNPPTSSGPINYLMYPYAEVGGRVLDFKDPKGFSYRITFRPDKARGKQKPGKVKKSGIQAS